MVRLELLSQCQSPPISNWLPPLWPWKPPSTHPLGPDDVLSSELTKYADASLALSHISHLEIFAMIRLCRLPQTKPSPSPHSFPNPHTRPHQHLHPDLRHTQGGQECPIEFGLGAWSHRSALGTPHPALVVIIISDICGLTLRLSLTDETELGQPERTPFFPWFLRSQFHVSPPPPPPPPRPPSPLPECHGYMQMKRVPKRCWKRPPVCGVCVRHWTALSASPPLPAARICIILCPKYSCFFMQYFVDS